MRTPSTTYADPPGRPLGGWLYLVAYTRNGGERVSILFRKRRTAERFAARVTDRGGSPSIWRHRLDNIHWERS